MKNEEHALECDHAILVDSTTFSQVRPKNGTARQPVVPLCFGMFPSQPITGYQSVPLRNCVGMFWRHSSIILARPAPDPVS